MKLIPFILSVLASVVCLVLSLKAYISGQENHTLQGQIIKKQEELQSLEQDAQTLQQDFQRQQQIIEAGANVAQKYGKTILSDIGIRAAKNKNIKLRDLLVRHNLDKSFIPTDEALKKMEEAAKTAPAPAPAPAPATHAPAAPTR